MSVVKLDAAGHVAGIRPGPATPGWIEAPDYVLADWYNWRLCEDGEWARKSEAECAAFERRHQPDPSEASQRLADLRDKRDRHGLTDDERNEVVGLLLDQYA